ncbi:hypothetical protein HC761_00215 [bacterium]|nr:hypothetical protein [bacterium]
MHHRFATGSLALAGGQVLVGLSSSTGALAAEPSTLTDLLAITKDSADTNLFFSRKSGSGSIVKVSLGAYAVNQVIDLLLYARPAGTAVFVKVASHNFDGTETVLLDTSYDTSIPAAATLLGRHHQIRNGAVAAAANIDLIRSYLESDY